MYELNQMLPVKCVNVNRNKITTGQMKFNDNLCTYYIIHYIERPIE